jgi:hypothetical protein
MKSHDIQEFLSFHDLLLQAMLMGLEMEQFLVQTGRVIGSVMDKFFHI